jgi:small subunit ribosomal protein S17
MNENKTKNDKKISGVVVSDKMTDTIIVKVESYKKHPKYSKFIKKTKKIVAHDAGNTAKVGDSVDIRESKPISKTKRFSIVK